MGQRGAASAGLKIEEAEPGIGATTAPGSAVSLLRSTNGDGAGRIGSAVGAGAGEPNSVLASYGRPGGCSGGVVKPVVCRGVAGVAFSPNG